MNVLRNIADRLDGTTKGVENFNGCPQKTITEEVDPLVYGLTLSSFYGWLGASFDDSKVYPRQAQVDCPMTTREVSKTGSREEVRQTLARIVGKEVCKNCPFAEGKIPKGFNDK